MPLIRYNRELPEPGHARRKKYESDPEYRDRAKRSSRRTYRRQNEVELTNCLHALAFFEDVSVPTKVVTTKLSANRTFECNTFTVAKAGDVLQVIYQTIWRWIKRDMIPAPILTSCQEGRAPLMLYHVEEVRVLLEEIGEHQKTVRYFRYDHRDVVDKIFKRIAAVRRDLNIEE